MAEEKILVVEDEEDINELVRYNLDQAGYNVSGVTSGQDAIEAVKEQKPDLIILDIMLPGIDGLDVCKIIKNDPDSQHIPIIMLTAKGEEADIVTGLELGADDYITKPFSPRVFVARVRTVLRRKKKSTADETQVLTIHGITIHPGRHEVLVNDVPVKLTATEFRILHFLARRPGWVFTRDQIIQAVHGIDYPATNRSIDVQVVGLRKKLGEAGDFIETVRGIGYRFKE